jgi:signal peptidase II
MNSPWIRSALLALVIATIGCDRVTKHIAAETLAGEPRQSFLGDTVRFEYVENTGAFLSLGADLPPVIRTALFTVGNGLILVATVFMAARLRWTGLQLFGLALVFAGGASNLADRIARGSVIDFMNVGLGSVRTGIFNVADVAILGGVGFLLFAHFLSSHESASRPSNHEAHEGHEEKASY